ncbi:hypothetical protein R6Q59_016529 [Mikania micrantha]
MPLHRRTRTYKSVSVSPFQGFPIRLCIAPSRVQDLKILEGFSKDMATYHGGDGRNEDPWNSNMLPGGCESSQPKKRRSKGKNLTSYRKYEQNNKKPLPLAVTTDEDQYRFVGDNNSDFIRLISNEVGKTVPFYYASWQDVPNEYKQVIYPTLFEFFDLQPLQDEGLWEGVKLGINAECAQSYKYRK